MTSIFINDEKISVSSSNAHQLMIELKIEAKNFSIALNQTFVPRAEYTSTRLNEGDILDFLTAMQGG